MLPAVTKPGIDLVLEGFGGSANSFAVRAFRKMQGQDYRIAHHVHAPSQITEGIRLGIPTVLLIRAPEDSAISLFSRGYYPSVGLAVKHHLRFHEALIPHLDKVVVADFNSVVSDFGGVIQRVNRKFGTTFASEALGEAQVKQIFEDMPRPLNEKPAPTEERAKAKEQVRAALDDPLLRRYSDAANELYALLLTHVR